MATSAGCVSMRDLSFATNLIRPAQTNILIADDRKAKIADFGLSKAWEEVR
jgi:serine/threonine protein kinase